MFPGLLIVKVSLYSFPQIFAEHKCVPSVAVGTGDHYQCQPELGVLYLAACSSPKQTTVPGPPPASKPSSDISFHLRAEGRVY